MAVCLNIHSGNADARKGMDGARRVNVSYPFVGKVNAMLCRSGGVLYLTERLSRVMTRLTSGRKPARQGRGEQLLR